MSPDEPAEQKAFRDKFDFPYPLLSDAGAELAKTYDAWKKMTWQGREYMGVERSTVLVDGEGVIREIWRQVNVDGHVDAVLLASKGLS